MDTPSLLATLGRPWAQQAPAHMGAGDSILQDEAFASHAKLLAAAERLITRCGCGASAGWSHATWRCGEAAAARGHIDDLQYPKREPSPSQHNQHLAHAIGLLLQRPHERASGGGSPVLPSAAEEACQHLLRTLHSSSLLPPSPLSRPSTFDLPRASSPGLVLQQQPTCHDYASGLHVDHVGRRDQVRQRRGGLHSTSREAGSGAAGDAGLLPLLPQLPPHLAAAGRMPRRSLPQPANGFRPPEGLYSAASNLPEVGRVNSPTDAVMAAAHLQLGLPLLNQQGAWVPFPTSGSLPLHEQPPTCPWSVDQLVDGYILLQQQQQQQHDLVGIVSNSIVDDMAPALKRRRRTLSGAIAAASGAPNNGDGAVSGHAGAMAQDATSWSAMSGCRQVRRHLATPGALCPVQMDGVAISLRGLRGNVGLEERWQSRRADSAGGTDEAAAWHAKRIHAHGVGGSSDVDEQLASRQPAVNSGAGDRGGADGFGDVVGGPPPRRVIELLPCECVDATGHVGGETAWGSGPRMWRRRDVGLDEGDASMAFHRRADLLGLLAGQASDGGRADSGRERVDGVPIKSEEEQQGLPQVCRQEEWSDWRTQVGGAPGSTRWMYEEDARAAQLAAAGQDDAPAPSDRALRLALTTLMGLARSHGVMHTATDLDALTHAALLPAAPMMQTSGAARCSDSHVAQPSWGPRRRPLMHHNDGGDSAFITAEHGSHGVCYSQLDSCVPPAPADRPARQALVPQPSPPRHQSPRAHGRKRWLMAEVDQPGRCMMRPAAEEVEQPAPAGGGGGNGGGGGPSSPSAATCNSVDGMAAASYIDDDGGAVVGPPRASGVPQRPAPRPAGKGGPASVAVGSAGSGEDGSERVEDDAAWTLHSLKGSSREPAGHGGTSVHRRTAVHLVRKSNGGGADGRRDAATSAGRGDVRRGREIGMEAAGRMEGEISGHDSGCDTASGSASGGSLLFPAGPLPWAEARGSGDGREEQQGRATPKAGDGAAHGGTAGRQGAGCGADLRTEYRYIVRMGSRWRAQVSFMQGGAQRKLYSSYVDDPHTAAKDADLILYKLRGKQGVHNFPMSSSEMADLDTLDMQDLLQRFHTTPVYSPWRATGGAGGSHLVPDL